MGDEYVSRLRQDVEMKLDYLCWAHNEPALHVAEHFAGLRRQVDYDAEKQIEIAREESDEDAISSVNDKRIEFIRILQELEKRIARQPKPEVGSNEIYASLKQRVEGFVHSSSSLDDLEESYVQLAREIIDALDRVEKRIFGEQTIVYWPHADTECLGSLVFFGDVLLGRRDIDQFLSATFSNDEPRRFQSSVSQLLVQAREPRELNKSQQVLNSLSHETLRQFVKASKFFYIGKTETEFSGYAAERSTIDKEFISYMDEETQIMRIEGDVCLNTSANLFDCYSSTSCELQIMDLQLESLHANLLPSPITRLTKLFLTGVHLESFDTTLLSTLTNLTHLSIQATFSKNVKFDLEFLRLLKKIESLELTLPGSSWDFSVFKEMTKLVWLKLDNSAFFYAKKLPCLSKAALAHILSAPCLEKLKLWCFDIETIDLDVFNSCSWLNSLDLIQSRISDSDQGADLNLGFPRLFDNPENDLSRQNVNSLSITLNHSGIRVLNAASFAGMKSLTELSLTGNLIADLPRGVFQDLISLKELELSKNRIKHISSGVFDKLDNLKTLKLDDNPIESIEANSFAQLHNLTELSINRCRLQSIDSMMFNGLKRLGRLELHNNLIERIEVVAEDGRRINVAKANLSDEEKRLVKERLFTDFALLSQLRLDGNKLEELDLNCFSNLKFAHILYLSSNKINELSGVAGPELLSSLTLLVLDDNQLTAINKSALPRRLQELEIAKNHLERLDEDFFAKFAQLKSVDFSENKLTMTITEATFASCRANLSWIDFSLNESIRATQGAFRQMLHFNNFERDFSDQFESLPRFESLRVRRFTPEIVRALKEFSKYEQDNHSQIESCCLSGCSIRTLMRNPDWNCELNETQTDLGHFNLSWLPNASELGNLNLSGNLIETLDDPDLFVDFTSIYKINLSDNGLSRIHRDIFKCQLDLEILDLSGNSLSSIDLGLFRHLGSLKHLDLSSNNISFLNLARLFRICLRLVSLNVADNQLDDRSTVETIDARSSYVLQELVLANNRFEKMDFVRDMTNLRHLDLRGNLIDSVMSSTGENLLGRLRELTHLDLSGNKISRLSEEMFSHLCGHLEHLDLSNNSFDFRKLDSFHNELI